MSTRVDAALAKLSAEPAPTGTEPSPEVTADASPAGLASGDGSAPADGVHADGIDPSPGSAGEGLSPGATKDELRAKLEADKERRLTKRDRFFARKERERAEAARKKAEEDAKEAEAKRSTWANLGKDKPIAEVLREAGRDPNEVFEAMKAEALKAGTPEARMEAMQKAYDARIAIIEKNAADDKLAREQEKKAAEERAFEAGVENDFRRMMTEHEQHLSPLLDEYPPEKLFRVARTLVGNPSYVIKQAEELKVDLTDEPGHINMLDILNVMRAEQARNQAYQEQRRNQRAAPQASQVAEAQAPSAKRPTVNGAEERKAGGTIGNDLASGRGGAVDRSGETRAQRLKRMIAEGKG